MRTAHTAIHRSTKTLLWGGALALLCTLTPQVARAALTGLYPTYLDWALANEWVEREVEDGKTNLTWQGGYEPTDDKDGDGLTNNQEIPGWITKVNGYTVW